MNNLMNRTNGNPEELDFQDLNVVERLNKEEERLYGAKSVGHWFKKNATNLEIGGGEMGGALGVFTAIAVLGD